jgi:parallel beta-helix repeat protein
LVIAAVVALLALAFAPPPAAAQTPGDVDCDGSVSSIDALLVLQLTARLAASLPCHTKADVNGDGSANSLDAAFILQRVAGLIDEFPSCDVNATPNNSQQAIDDAGAGTTICLGPGTYDPLFFYRKTDVRLVGSGPQTVITDNPDNHTCVLVIESRGVTVEGVLAFGCEVQGAFAGDSTNIRFDRVETAGGPIGFQYQRSTGRIESSEAHDHSGQGAIIQLSSNVTIDDSTFRNNVFGVIAQESATLRVQDGHVSNNSDGGIFTLHRTGNTTIDNTTIASNGLNVFTGVPGCADLPPANSDPPQCFVDNPDAFVSEITITIEDSEITESAGTGVVIFPGVNATLLRNEITGSDLTGLFAWGATVTAGGNVYDRNIENAVECRAYPAPATGDHGMCTLTYERIAGSLPLPDNVLGGGFVSEGGEFRLRFSVIESNWGIGVSVHNGGKGEITDNTIRNNGGTAFCISNATWSTIERNRESGNRAGSCLGHP